MCVCVCVCVLERERVWGDVFHQVKITYQMQLHQRRVCCCYKKSICIPFIAWNKSVDQQQQQQQ